MANNQDVQAILAALSQAGPPGTGMAPQQAQYSPYASNQGPPGAPSYQQPPPQAPPGQAPAPAYSGVIPTPPPGNYSQYGLPQPTASGSIDLNSIRPASHGNVNFQDALSKVKEYASAHGIQSPNGAAPPPRYDPRMAARPPPQRQSRSQTPPRNYNANPNPYRDERRDDPRRAGAYGRERSRSPSRATRTNFSPPRDRDYGREDPESEVMMIDSGLVGLVIGRGGENLKRIEKETGARIQFITGPQHTGPQRECRLTGAPRCRDDARAEITRIVAENGGPAPTAGRPNALPPGNANRGMREERSTSNQPVLREGENSIQIMVPDRTVGLIIGRGGETIRDLQERSQCHINIVGENKSLNGLRPVNLIGSAQAAQRAKDLIMEIVESDTRAQEAGLPPAIAPPRQQERYPSGGGGGGPPGRGGGGADRITETIRVPSDSVGMIIGKGGETIKQLQQETGCKINVQQASGQDIERPIDLVGDHAAIERARAAIMDKVEQVREKNRAHQEGRSHGGRSDQQQYGGGGGGGGNPYSQPQSQYGQPAASGPPPAQGQADPADPYAVYGGYQNYVMMWALSQQQSGQGGAPPQ